MDAWSHLKKVHSGTLQASLVGFVPVFLRGFGSKQGLLPQGLALMMVGLLFCY